MAMISKAAKQQPALERKIRSFYGMLNRRDFESCHQLIDPRVRDTPGSVTLFQYENALQEFMDQFGPLKILELHVTLHLDEPNKLYGGRDFAMGKTILLDKGGDRHVFLERWVRERRAWYTRSTGLVTPNTAQTTPSPQSEASARNTPSLQTANKGRTRRKRLAQSRH